MNPRIAILTLTVALLVSSQMMADDIYTPRKVKLERIPYAYIPERDGGKKIKWEYVLLMGGVAYRNVEELKTGVTQLPKGSQITWSPGCERMGGEPLNTEKEIQDLKKHCEANSVTFIIIPSG